MFDKLIYKLLIIIILTYLYRIKVQQWKILCNIKDYREERENCLYHS